MNNAIRRHVLGGLALALLAAAAAALAGFPAELDANTRTLYGSMCLRTGLILALGWLAFQQVAAVLARSSPRLMVVFALVLLTVIVRPKALPFALLVIALVAGLEVLGWLLKPLRQGGKPRKSN